MHSFESYVQNYIVTNSVHTHLTDIPKVDLEDFLLENKILDTHTILKLKQEYYCVKAYQTEFIAPITLSPKAKALCINHLILPIKITDLTLEVVMDNPFLLDKIETLRLLTKRQIICKVGLKPWIKTQVNNIALAEQQNNVNSKPNEDIFGIDESGDYGENISLDDEGAIKSTLKSIISRAIYARASDIHIEPQINKIVVRFRIDGNLKIVNELPSKHLLELINCVKVFAKMDITERKKPQDGYISFKGTQTKYDLRISTMPNMHGEKVVIRLRSSEDTQTSLDELGMNADNTKLMQYLLNLKEGMVIVTGPTGSGKSTTLVSVLNSLKSASVNIVTIEDPVETLIDGITQVAVNEKQGLNFETALRATLRQDIDILMIGEMRDKVTADIATSAALTGHSIWTTLHTENSVGAIFRLSDMGVDSLLIKETIKGVIAQRLLRRLCPHCKQHNIPIGCDKCNGEGYSGRIGIYEILIPHMHLNDYVYENMMDTAIKNGLITLQHQAQVLINQGITSYEEAERVLGNLKGFSSIQKVSVAI